MKKALTLLLLLITSNSNSKSIDPYDGTFAKEVDSQSSQNPMLMKSKPKIVLKKIERDVGFYDDSNLYDDPELDDQDIDISVEEKEIDIISKEIRLGLADDLTNEKLEKVKTDIKLENEALEETEVRYNKLKKIDSTPREPSDSEEIEVSPY